MENRYKQVDIKRKSNAPVVMAISFLLIILATFLIFFRSSKTESDNGTNDKTAQNEIKKGTPISSADLLKKINLRDEINILDIRSGDQFNTEHILDSKNIYASNFETYLKNADKKAFYVIVDSSGSEAALLSYKISEDFGIKNIYYLEKGFDFWKSQLNPTIREGDPTSFSDQSKVKYIKSDELKKFVDDGNAQIKIVDIRKKQLFDEGHIKESINIPSEELESRRKELPRGKNLITVDATGASAFSAAVKLFDMGFFNILVFSDGLDIWKQKGFELVK